MAARQPGPAGALAARMLRVLAVIVVGAGAHGLAWGGSETDDLRILQRMWQRAGERLAAASAQWHVHKPPVRRERAVVWASSQIVSIDGGELLDVMAVDDDGDQQDELVVLLDDEVVWVELSDGTPVLVRRSITEASPVWAPRARLGTVARAGATTVRIRSSEQALGWRVARDGDELVLDQPREGFPVCGTASAELMAGRSWLSAVSLSGDPAWAWLPPASLHIACSRAMIGENGWPLRALGAVSPGGTLAIRVVSSCDPAGLPSGVSVPACGTVRTHSIEGVGDTFAFADLDLDGTLEVIVSSRTAPGDADQLRVISLTAGTEPQVIPLAGAVGGITVIHALTGPQIVVGIQRPGGIELWRLNE